MLAKFAFWKPLVAVPNDVIFRKIDQVPTFIFAKRHFGVREFDELFLVGIHFRKREGRFSEGRFSECRMQMADGRMQMADL